MLTPSSRRVQRLAALAFFAGLCWLVLLLSHGHDGLAEWSITLTLVVLVLARGIGLGRPVTTAHGIAAVALLAAGLGLRLLSWTWPGDVLVIAAAVAVVAPMASRPEPASVPRIWPLVRATHGDPLAPFAMHSRKSHYVNGEGSAAVAYRTMLGLAVVSGDPLGPGDAFPSLATGFVAMCRSRGWRVAVLGCGQERIPLWHNAISSLHAIPIGCDVEVDVPRFTTEGRRFRNLRQAVSRSRNHGVTTQLIGEQDLGDALASELAEVVDASGHGGRWQRGFSMILDGALEGRYPGVALMIGRSADGTVQGFHRYLVAGEGSDVTLDVPWRRPEAPNGLDERLAVDMIEWCKAMGTQRLSLAFAAFPDLFDNPNRSRVEDFYYRVITLGGPLIRLETIYRYLQKFHALGAKRYVLVSLRHFPLALIVLLTLEFLPRRRTRSQTARAGRGDTQSEPLSSVRVSQRARRGSAVPGNWGRQHYDDCALMAVADVVGELTGTKPSEDDIIALATCTPNSLGSGPIYALPGDPDSANELPRKDQLPIIKDLPILLAHFRVHSFHTDDTIAAGDGPATGVTALAGYLAQGKKVIVSLNGEIIWDIAGDRTVHDHDVVVIAVDTAAGVVHLNDSATPHGDNRINTARFELAWKTSSHAMVVAG